MKEVVIALITVGGSILSAVITAVLTYKKSEQSIKVTQAVLETKLELLTEEVKEHNNYAHRVPVLEEQMRVVNHRIRDLEKEEEK